MKECNAKAADKKADERKKFMSECLSAKPVKEESKGTSQQNKMKECNIKAGSLKGDERKQFMSSCLSGK
ncbi:MAG: phosphate starvation-inducible protein PsiF [Nitrospirae bacterium]|nr:phosphate starvation-inducible protein PsiF [Nitrospirota bacterium]